MTCHSFRHAFGTHLYENGTDLLTIKALLGQLQILFEKNKLTFSNHCIKLKNTYEWNEFRNSLYNKTWIPYIKETFNGFGNAIDYLGRYTHRIAISNNRIKSVTGTNVTFAAKDY